MVFNRDYKIKKEACYACPIGCSKKYQVKDGKYKGLTGSRIEFGAASIGPMTGVFDWPGVLHMKLLCDRYGIDTIEAVSYTHLKDSMEKLYPVFIENGAMKTAKLPAPVAYHTPLAKKHIQEFESCVRDIEVKDIRIPICSMYSNQMLCRKEQLQRELVINLYRKMNAAGCIEAIMQKRERIFFEIGAGKSLYKIYRSINGEINILKNLREGN